MKLSTLYKSPALLITIFLFATFSVNAQHTSTHVHQQNVFISMMDTMMIRMDAVVVGISPAHDFIEQMIPYHQGAIEMTAYEIQHGKNFKMKKIAIVSAT